MGPRRILLSGPSPDLRRGSECELEVGREGGGEEGGEEGREGREESDKRGKGG